MKKHSKSHAVLFTIVTVGIMTVLAASLSAEEVDIAPLLAPLRNKSLNISDKVKGLIQAKLEFDKKNKEKIGEGFFIEVDEKYAANKIAEAEKKSPVRLPDEYKSLLSTVGQIEINDSYFIGPDFFGNAYDQMIKDWGTPEEEMKKLDQKTTEFLKARTILFTEVGDGLGGVLYGSDGYHYIHQDTMDPQPLKNAMGKDMDFNDIFLWIVNEYGAHQYEGSNDNIIVIDSISGYRNPEK